MMATLAQARAAVADRRWQDAFDAFAALEDQTLAPSDLVLRAIAAGMLARWDVSSDAWTKAYEACLQDDPARAARCAFWLAMQFMNRGEHAHGGAWFARAGKAVEAVGGECAEAGLLCVPQGIMSLEGGDTERALALFQQAKTIADQSRDADLAAMAYLGTGSTLIAQGDTVAGLAELDQAMVAIAAEDIMPVLPGIVYCAVILACIDAFDVRRAHEWTRALDAWSAPQQGLVPFRGQCLVHRSQIAQFRGAWDDAIREAESARARLGDPPGQPAVGMAYYQLGELHRMRGAFDAAEVAYRDANRAGHPIQPGLALLRLAQGQTDSAATSISIALEEARDPATRIGLLPAAVTIAIAAGDLPAARGWAEDLSAAAISFDAPLLRATADSAMGAVLVTEGEHAAALAKLRDGLRRWQELDAPYQAARTRLDLAAAYRALGDADAAAMETDAARSTFADLGAEPDLAALDGPAHERPGGLTAREAEILKLVATGKTNKAIAAELVISQKTVARHLANIFTKLDLSTRAEATAYAFKHGLA